MFVCFFLKGHMQMGLTKRQLTETVMQLHVSGKFEVNGVF